MEKLKLKPAIDTQIVLFFDMLQAGDLLKTDDVWKFVKRRLGKTMDRETVVKYMRNLRQAEVINYTCICKARREIQVLEIGQPHSL